MISREKAAELAELLYGGRRYPSSFTRVAQRLLKDPEQLMGVLVRAGVAKEGPNGIGYVVMPAHNHDWRYAWGLLVCANNPCPDYGAPGKKPWPLIPGWESLNPKTFPKYNGTDPEVIERHRLEDEEDEEDDDD